MKKFGLCFLSTLLMFNSFAQSQEVNQEQTEPEIPNELMMETLSLAYGAPVELIIDENSCQVNYPATEIKEIETPSENETEQSQNTEDKTIITPIAATTALCSPVHDFNGLPQYKVEHSSANKLIAQIYNNLGLSFVKDIDIKTFNEEQTIVPQIGLISSRKIHLADAVYTEKDENTGLKKQIGNLQEMTWQESLSPAKDTVKYVSDIKLDNLNVVLPMFSLHLDSEHQATEAIYKNTDAQPFNYTNLLQNITALISSRTRAVIKGVRLKSDMLDMGISYDIEMKSQAQAHKKNYFVSSGSIIFNNISFTGDILPQHQQPKSIVMKVALDHLQMQTLGKLVQIQQEIYENPEAEIDDEKIISVVDELFNTAKFTTDIKVNFAHAGLFLNLNMHRQGEYLVGNGKIVINNLYNIFPEIKTCLKNPNTPECNQNIMYMGLSSYLDLSKNSSVNLLKYTNTGIYLNNQKIAEPIKFNLKEMWKEQQKEETAEKMLNDLTANETSL